MTSVHEPPDQAALQQGLREAIDMYLQEADLRYAPGETGVIRCEVEVQLDRGRVQRTKGSVYFVRTFQVGAR